MSENQSFAGRFIWREAVSTDVEKTVAFYGELFNWKAEKMDMGDMQYTMLKSGDETVAGVMASPMPGVPSNWLSYISVEDVDAAVLHVTGNGGQVKMPAYDIPNVGRAAIVQDSTGAVFAAFKGVEEGATDATARPNDYTFCWGQLNTKDVDGALAFYAPLMHWNTSDMPGPMKTVICSWGEHPVATIMELPAQAPAPSHWLNYVSVPSCDDSYKRALKLGAKSFHEPMDIPGMGRFAVLADTTGAVFALWTHAAQE